MMKTSIPGVAPLMMENLAHLPACVSYEVAAHETGLGVSTLRRYADEGRLRVMKTAPGSGGGGRVLIPKVELARLLTTLMGPATSPRASA